MSTDSTHRSGTLSEWCERNGVKERPFGFDGPPCMLIPDITYPPGESWALYHLADYGVSSVIAGTIWLYPIV